MKVDSCTVLNGVVVPACPERGPGKCKKWWCGDTVVKKIVGPHVERFRVVRFVVEEKADRTPRERDLAP